jgi:hypothetical protein
MLSTFLHLSLINNFNRYFAQCIRILTDYIYPFVDSWLPILHGGTYWYNYKLQIEQITFKIEDLNLKLKWY